VLVDVSLLDEPVLWMRTDPDTFVVVEPDTLGGRWKARVELLSF
jgi:hypothetical protein